MAADLVAAAEAAVGCLGVSSGESVLIVYNDAQRTIAQALGAAAAPRARTTVMLEYPPPPRHGQEPPPQVAEAMLAADVVLAPTARSLTQTEARIAATNRGVRVASLPTITDEIFARAVAVDYAELKRISEAIAARLTSASTARVTSPAGTDIVLSLEGRTGRSDDGDLRHRGAIGNLPAGEGYVAPVETAGDGAIVVDGSLPGRGRLEEAPVRLTVARGRLVHADGDGAGWLLETLDAGGEHGRSIAELGIGTNPSATLSGNVLEDEKVSGTIHVAFGTNVGLGGVNIADVHIDGVVLRPTVELDAVRVVEDGRLLMRADAAAGYR